MKREKKAPVEEPFAVKVKLDELNIAHNDLREQTRTAQIKELMRSQVRLINLAKQASHNLIKTAALPFSLRVNRTNSRGDFFGKFHPSKSNKGVKRSPT